MAPAFRQYLDGAKIYGCATCRTHVADNDDIVSKVRVFFFFFFTSDDDDDLLSKPFSRSSLRPLGTFFLIFFLGLETRNT